MLTSALRVWIVVFSVSCSLILAAPVQSADLQSKQLKRGKATTAKRDQLKGSFMLILEGFGASEVALGDSSKAVTERLGEPVIQSFPPGRFDKKESVYLTYFNRGVSFALKDDRVVAIFLYAEQSDRSGTYLKYPGKTPKGVGPKSHEEEVVRAYGRPDEVIGETHYYNLLGIAFDFDKIRRVKAIRIFTPK